MPLSPQKRAQMDMVVRGNTPTVNTQPQSNPLMDFGKGLVKPLVDAGRLYMGAMQTAPSAIKAIDLDARERITGQNFGARRAYDELNKNIENSTLTPEQRVALSGSDWQAAKMGIKTGAGLVPYLAPYGTTLPSMVGAGAVAGGFGAASQGEDFNVRDIAQGALLGGAIAPAVSVAARGVGSAVSGAGRGFEKAAEMRATAGMGSPKTIGAVRRLTGNDVVGLFDKYNLWDKSPETIQAALNKVDDQYKALTYGSSKQFNIGKVLKDFNKQIAKTANQAREGSTTAADELAILIERKNQFINNVGNRTSGQANVSQLARSKAIVDTDLPKTAFGKELNPGKTSANMRVRDIFKRQLNKSTGAGQLGREEAALGKLLDVSKSMQDRASARMPINFTKLGSATAGGVVGGIPGAVTGYIAEQAVNSPVGVKMASKGLQKIGRALSKPSTFSKKIPDSIKGSVISGSTSVKRKKKDKYEIVGSTI